MEFYAVAGRFIDPEDMRIFGQITKTLYHLPDITFDPDDRNWGSCRNQVTCHLICRALADFFDVSYRDGYFTPGYQHSWLRPISGSSIIDPYPVAGAAPIIVAAGFYSPWSRFYRESPKFHGIFETTEFKARLEQTTQVVGETVGKLNFKPPSP